MTATYDPLVISRLAASASVLLVLLSAAIVWRLSVSPDSDWHVGLVVALPFLGIATGLGLTAYWTRGPSDART